MNSSPTKVLIFWDYDTQWGGDRSRAPGGAKSWGSLEFTCTERILELFSDFGLLACFAVVGAAALPGSRPYHDPAQVRRIHEAGHEIASHSFQHDWLPGLSGAQLIETLRRSREALEDCIGAEVTSFVPPYNQPFDYPRRGSISLSERLETLGRGRTDLPRLCRALRATGYRFCRVAYRPLWRRAADRLVGRRTDGPVMPELIEGITCLRVNAPCGFDTDTCRVIERCRNRPGAVVAHGHPHSLHSGNAQDERHLVPFLRRVRELVDSRDFEVVLPRDLTEARDIIAVL